MTATGAASPSIRRSLGWVVVAALCVAALTAIVALLTGSFDDTDWRIIGTSVGFGFYSALAGAGASVRARSWSCSSC